MTQEEKAKAYDNLLIKLQKAKVDNNVCDERYCCVIDDIVPELKESEDEKIRKELIAYCQVNMGHTWHNIKQEDYIAWLKKQGEKGTNGNEREIPNSAWSEEDEKMFNSALWHVKNSCGNSGKNSGEFEVYNWLKSLRPQPTWKPSDEQMKQLGWIAKQNKNNMIGKELVSLYQDLKKLRGE